MVNIKQFLEVWRDTLTSMKKIKFFLPFVSFAIIQFLFLFILVNFYKTPFDNIFVPFISKYFGAQFLHYPNNYFILPFLFNNTNIILGGLFGIVFIGVATLYFANHFQAFKKKRKNYGYSYVISKYGVLFVLWLIESIFVLSIIIGLPILFQKFAHLEYMEMRILQLVSFFLGILIASIFAFTTAAAILDEQGVKKSLKQSINIFANHIIFTFLLVAIPNLINLPFSYLAGKTQFIIQKFNPEMVTVMLGITIMVSILSNFLLVGCLTRFYISQRS